MAVTAFAAPASADYLIEETAFRTYDGALSSPIVRRTSWEKNRIRFDTPGTSTIYDFDGNTIWLLNHARKEYVALVLSKALRSSQESLLSLVGVMIGTIEGGEHGKDPPQAVKDRFGPITLSATGEVATIAGFTSRKYRVLREKRELGEMWMTTAIDFSALKRHLPTLLDLTRLTPSGVAYEAMLRSGKGLAVKWTIDREDSAHQERELVEITRVKKQRFGADTFTVPAGYRKVDYEKTYPDEK